MYQVCVMKSSRKRPASSLDSDRPSLTAVEDRNRDSKRTSAGTSPKDSARRAKKVSAHRPCKNGCQNQRGNPKQARCKGYFWECYLVAYPEIPEAEKCIKCRKAKAPRGQYAKFCQHASACTHNQAGSSPYVRSRLNIWRSALRRTSQ